MFFLLPLPYEINSKRVSHEHIELESVHVTNDQKFINRFSRIFRLIDYKLNGKEEAFFIRYEEIVSRIESSHIQFYLKLFHML